MAFGLTAYLRERILILKWIDVDAAPNLNRMDITSMFTNVHTQFIYVLMYVKVFFLMLSQLLLLLLLLLLPYPDYIYLSISLPFTYQLVSLETYPRINRA